MVMAGPQPAVPPVVQLPTRGWLVFFRNFAQLAGPYWSSDDKWRARGLITALVILTAALVAIQIAFNVWTERLFDTLAKKSLVTFLTLIGVFGVLLAFNVAVAVMHLRIKRRIQISWRRWLTRRLAGEWMNSGRHYQVTYMPGEHSNPDGRIAEDIRIATEYAIELGQSLLYCVFLLISFANILWVLSGPLSFQLNSFEINFPGHLLWIAIVYSIIGAIIALFLGRPLVRAVDNRQTQEQNFRFGLVHARENSLAIALLQGEPDERRHLSGLFGDVIDAWNRQTFALVNIFMFSTSWSVLLPVFPVLLAAPRYIAGVITLGVLMRIADAFQQAVSALSWPVSNLPQVAEWRASAERVLRLDEAIQSVIRHVAPGNLPTMNLVTSTQPLLAFRQVSIMNPDRSVVIEGVNLEFRRGEHVLLSGDPGATIKLFKAVAGLWPWGSGKIELPNDANVFFMPRQPYMPIGTLREAICYPASTNACGEAMLHSILELVELTSLVPRLDQVETWEQVLAIDDLQRLAFARLLVHRPAWIFLQEATDALGVEGERAMLDILQKELPKATVIAIDNHAANTGYYVRALHVTKSDGYAVIEERNLALN